MTPQFVCKICNKLLLNRVDFTAHLRLHRLLEESDIVYDVEPIDYFVEKNRKYYPDFYIPHANLIVEIKSNWSKRVDRFFNAKQDATKKCGYNYLCIEDNKFNLLLGYLEK